MNLKQEEKAALLSDRRVIEEINRHLWIESEKAGFDIGFDQAKEDWLVKFSKAWMQYHFSTGIAGNSKTTASKKSAAVQTRRRRAKSYIR